MAVFGEIAERYPRWCRALSVDVSGKLRTLTASVSAKPASAATPLSMVRLLMGGPSPDAPPSGSESTTAIMARKQLLAPAATIHGIASFLMSAGDTSRAADYLVQAEHLAEQYCRVQAGSQEGAQLLAAIRAARNGDRGEHADLPRSGAPAATKP
jgi:hypothetical protein